MNMTTPPSGFLRTEREQDEIDLLILQMRDDGATYAEIRRCCRTTGDRINHVLKECKE